MDPETLRVAARIARQRAQRSVAVSQGDGMSRLGAQRALEQLARDLEASARQFDPPARRRNRSA
jgi:hypothetical protein